ncbi:MAG TPA: GMC family oxidoreductase [Methylocella sp.]
MIIDSRSIDDSTSFQTDLCIIGAGAAGISIALEFLSKSYNVILLESGGLRSDPMTQSLYDGKNVGLTYDRLDEARSRYFGGSTNCWGGHCRPLDSLDFKKRDGVPNSGWPFGKEELHRYYERSHSLLKLGVFDYDEGKWSQKMAKDHLFLFPLDRRSLNNVISQISPPAKFGDIYRAQLSGAGNIKVMLFSNATEIQTNDTATTVTGVRVRTLNGKSFTISARIVVLAAGGIENARLLLLSNQTQKMGLGNGRDLVGRYFMDHPRIRSDIVRINAQQRHRRLYDQTMVLSRAGYFDGDARISAHVAPTSECQRKLLIPNSRTYLAARYASGMSKAYLALRAISKLVKGRARFGYPFGDMAREIIRAVPSIVVNAPQAILGILDVHLNPGFVKRDFELTTIIEPIPNYESRVTLSPACDRLGLNQVRVDWQLTEKDKLHFISLRKLLTEEMTRQGVLQFAGEPVDLAEIWPKNIAGCWHHMGTTRMDSDRTKGVVDANCRVHGISNLFVAGSSVFPTVGSDMPTITIVAMALRLAGELEATLDHAGGE